MRTPRALPVYPWGDNEKLEFGDSADYAIYFDGTNFLIDSGTHSLEIDLATASKAKIYGGDAVGDDTILYANSAEATARVEINGGGQVEVYATQQNVISTGGIKLYTSGAIGTSGAIDLILTPTVNQDVFLNPTGTGRVKFGTVVGTGDVVSNGHILIQDAAGNSVKLMTTA
ncbi:MAG: hypothetical protein ABID09_03380 [Candidatus Omnitrophota bacterium]